jgi:aspartyl-tRNA(Asn)/glutamyl-tRNA(Gln) amidotransferase subunit C
MTARAWLARKRPFGWAKVQRPSAWARSKGAATDRSGWREERSNSGSTTDWNDRRVLVAQSGPAREVEARVENLGQPSDEQRGERGGQATPRAGVESRPFGPERVAHVARLARLELDDATLRRFALELGRVLEHAAYVIALDTTGVPPTSHPFELRNVLRPDAVHPSLARDAVLECAPEAEGGWFKVPPILGSER